MQIRAMTDVDVPRVAEILSACFAWLGRQEGFNSRQVEFLTGPRSDPQTVREEAKTRPHLVACRDGQVVGMAVVNGSELARLYVDPHVHRSGVGKALFAAAEEMIRAAGHTEMHTGALVESARAFYVSMGMRPAGQVAWEPEIFPNHPVTLLTKQL
jgi:ribosomal protein S18 acetylase RimI-like enzyme